MKSQNKTNLVNTLSRLISYFNSEDICLVGSLALYYNGIKYKHRNQFKDIDILIIGSDKNKAILEDLLTTKTYKVYSVNGDYLTHFDFRLTDSKTNIFIDVKWVDESYIADYKECSFNDSKIKVQSISDIVKIKSEWSDRLSEKFNTNRSKHSKDLDEIKKLMKLLPL